MGDHEDVSGLYLSCNNLELWESRPEQSQAAASKPPAKKKKRPMLMKLKIEEKHGEAAPANPASEAQAPQATPNAVAPPETQPGSQPTQQDQTVTRGSEGSAMGAGVTTNSLQNPSSVGGHSIASGVSNPQSQFANSILSV